MFRSLASDHRVHAARAALIAGVVAFGGAPAAALAQAPAETSPSLADLPIEQLMDIQVTSVGKKPEPLSGAAAAVFVITQEDIRHSGLTSLPELLRLAPGLDVAQVDARHWAISARGFNDVYSSKLLVLVDGRTVYTPTFSGVLWDMEDIPVDQIERIEVIRGPGGAIWGANAVNGVIDIITKPAKDGEGPAVSVSGGGEGAGPFTLAYAGALADRLHYRVYVSGFDRTSSETLAGGDAGDGWRSLRAHFRLDWDASDSDQVLTNGGYYREGMDNLVYAPSLVSPPTAAALVQHNGGGNLQVGWTHRFPGGSTTFLQAYYDRVDYEDYGSGVRLDTYDLEFNHRFRFGRQDVVWGAGYRRVDYDGGDRAYVTLDPARGQEQIFNVFGQDEVDLGHNLHLIGGLKLEHNTFTGWEYEPSLRLAWRPSADHTVWAAVSRAVRIPSFGEEFIRLDAYALPATGGLPPILIQTTGNPGAQVSERLVAWEAGYRGALRPTLSVDLSLFYNRYSRLSSYQLEPPVFVPAPGPPHLLEALRYGNLLSGETHGFEASARWQVLPKWRLTAGYSLLLGDVPLAPGLDPLFQRNLLDRSPAHQFQLRSDVDLPGRTELDASIYRVGALPAQGVPAYTRIDLRLGWRPRDRLSIGIAGRNLLQPRRLEFPPIAYAAPSEIPRTVVFMISAGF